MEEEPLTYYLTHNTITELHIDAYGTAVHVINRILTEALSSESIGLGTETEALTALQEAVKNLP